MRTQRFPGISWIFCIFSFPQIEKDVIRNGTVIIVTQILDELFRKGESVRLFGYLLDK